MSTLPNGEITYHCEMQESRKKTFLLSWIACLISLGSFIQSYITCAIAGALPFIAKEFSLTPLKEGHATSFILLGGLAGAILSGYCANQWGRKNCLFLAAATYLATASLSFAISSYTELLVLRLITGLAVGFTMNLVPMYLAEIAPAAKRGAFVTLYQLSLTLGTLAAYGGNSYFTASHDWRAMFFMAMPLSLVLLIGLFTIPESPKWLIKKNQVDKANAIAKRLYDAPSLIETAPIASASIWMQRFRFLLGIGIVLAIFQQLSGVGSVVYFTPRILKEAGFSSDSGAIFATLILGIANCLATIISLFFIDRMGRRTLYFISQVGIIASLSMLFLSSLIDNPWIDKTALVCLMTFIFSYSLGVGPVTWVLISEIYPIAIREKAIALLTFLNGLSSYFVVVSFPSCCAQIGSPTTFLLYTICTLGSFLFFLRYLPETKGKTLEELEKSL